MAKQLLTDILPIKLTLDEGKEGGKVVVRGEFAKSDIATENKRVYPGTLWEKQIGRLGKALKERRVFGELDHPSDGRTSLQRVSHIVTGLTVKDGIVVGEAEIVPTAQGNNLAALLRSGCRVGVSSRGYGSVKKNAKEEDVVQDDYKLVTFDFVAEPADTGAFPEVFAEGKQAIFEGVEIDPSSLEEKTDEELAAQFAARVNAEADKNAPKNTPAERFAAAVVADAEKAKANEGTDIRAEFEKTLAEALLKAKETMRDEIKAEMLADPTVAQAKRLMDSVTKMLAPHMVPMDVQAALKAKDEEISNLNAQVKKLSEDNQRAVMLAKELGYKFFVERTLSGDVDAELIRTAIGDVKTYETSDALKLKIESIRSDLRAKREEEKRIAEEAAAKRAIAEAEAKKLAETFEAEKEKMRLQISKLTEALDESVKTAKDQELRLYVEQNLTNHPKAAKIRTVIASTKFSTKEEVDAMFESFRETVRDADELAEARARVRRTMSPEAAPKLEEQSSVDRPAVSDNYNGLGVDLKSLQHLAGVKKK